MKSFSLVVEGKPIIHKVNFLSPENDRVFLLCLSTSVSWPGVTKHRNGMERNGIYRNKPEYTGTRRNDAGMDKNGTGMYRNEPE